jgi:serine/threonine-protein kinase
MAHHHGLIHRDLKPSNFFVVNTERGDQIRVVDFGIAVALSESKSKEKVIAGTTRYFAPEYLRDQEISPRLDVYQMGVVMLELLTGQPAFEDRGTATIFDIIDGKIRRPPDFDRHPLSSVINRAVALDPKERYADGAEMCQALTEVAQRIGLSHLLSPSL